MHVVGGQEGRQLHKKRYHLFPEFFFQWTSSGRKTEWLIRVAWKMSVIHVHVVILISDLFVFCVCRTHCMHCIDQPVSTDVGWSVCLSVCLFVCLLGTWVSHAKMAEPIRMPFGG